MRITSYGSKEIAISIVLLGGLSWGLWTLGGKISPALGLTAVLPVIVLIWVISFFRDPKRELPEGEGLVLCPADGTVTAIDDIDEPDFIGGPARRVSIFMSIFNVHVNRAPFAGKVAYNKHRDGQFLNAMNSDSSHLNEANDMGLETGDRRMPKVKIRQVAGLIARRIVCDREVGDELARGEIFGMIKFSSRVELYIPGDTKIDLRVKVGDKVKAGATVIGELCA
jgi:phosphatidylserine decarboxylase